MKKKLMKSYKGIGSKVTIFMKFLWYDLFNIYVF